MHQGIDINSNLHCRAIAYISFSKRISAHPEPLVRFKCSFTKHPASWLYEKTENQLQGSGMAISKKTLRVFKIADLEIIVWLPTSTLKLKSKIDTNKISIYIDLQDIFMAFRPI
jgi:hypothetical protein